MQMSSWRLGERKDFLFNKWVKHMLERFNNNLQEFSTETFWRYYTQLHLVGADVHMEETTHRKHLTLIQQAVYFDQKTMEAMETRYLTRIVELRNRLAAAFPLDVSVSRAARLVVNSVVSSRQSSRTTRGGRIQNKKFKIQDEFGTVVVVAEEEEAVVVVVAEEGLQKEVEQQPQ